MEIGLGLPGSQQSQMFGKPCFKVNGKAFICLYNNCMVFKLSSGDNKSALSLEGAVFFDPSGKGRPMKEWVQLPFEYSKKWTQFATAAMKYVSTTS